MQKCLTRNSKSGIKYVTEVTLKVSLNVVGDSNDENNFLHKLLLTNANVSEPRKAFAQLIYEKTQLHKIGKSGGYLSRLLRSLIKTGLPLRKNILKPLAKSVLTTLGLTAVVSATDTVIHKKIFASGTTTIINSNKK